MRHPAVAPIEAPKSLIFLRKNNVLRGAGKGISSQTKSSEHLIFLRENNVLRHPAVAPIEAPQPLIFLRKNNVLRVLTK